MSADPTPELYRSVFDYDPATGSLTWKKELPSGLYKREADRLAMQSKLGGKPAGYFNSHCGSAYVNCFGKMRKLHRIIWEMHHGPIAHGILIDHRDGDPANNRMDNLREASKSTNGMNRGCNKGSKTRMKGVFLDARDGVFFAEITVMKDKKYLGRFPTKGLAAVAYAKASIRYHGQFSNYLR